MITLDQIEIVQKNWGDGIVKMGSLKSNFKLCKEFTSIFLLDTYNLKAGKILFKPTKASKEQFRPNFEMVMSYFIGGEDSFCKEDQGFAMKPWAKVSFENSGFIFEESRAIVMGNYFFTDLNGDTTKVEYSFGYKLINSKLYIDLHHSSLPFSL
ncbi:hypothetical protein N8383_01640 [Flavobacteriaceae bacterium]|jgi:hypothetical protein|nr:hypothetical protein [Flavobacteriaceae bacterium]MDC1492108.1 hypothetical protein [Flavobacteriaceae bacterium]MDC1534938.1 hypothetical protein [Flavobacteriaceae bacterium]